MKITNVFGVLQIWRFNSYPKISALIVYVGLALGMPLTDKVKAI
jgi:hypothetical protein